MVFRWPLLAALVVVVLTGCATTPRTPAPDVRLVPWLSASGKYGYVDESGALRIPAQYDDARPFYHSLAAASQDKRWGYIDTLGRWVVGPHYDKAYDFNANGQGEVLTVSDAFNLGGSLLPMYLTGKRVYYRVYDADGLLVKQGKINGAGHISD
ncbi:MAG TPA: WG repeat-containing protein, partial [Burkholderiaceae bacterium]|nr:WG repeat-containing protein [Burkholderiaceae bacterium]